MADQPSVPPELPAERQWVAASSELRATAKWVIASLAAVATVVFGAGPIVTRPNLDIDEDLPQLAVAGALGVAGLIGIGMLIYVVSKVLLPVGMTLSDLPSEFRSRVDERPEGYLPEGALNFDEFLAQLRALRTASLEIPGKIADTRQHEAEAQRAGDKNAYDAAVAEAEAYQEALEETQENLATFESARSDLIDQGAFDTLSRTFSDRSRLLWGGALLAGIGGLGFQLALTSSPADTGASTEKAKPVGVAILTARSGEAELWAALGLDGCTRTSGQVPVVVTGGSGTTDAPYVVRTVPDAVAAGACPALEFAATPDLFSVVFPTPQKIVID